MNRKIIIRLSVIGLVLAMAVGAVAEYFSNRENSIGDTFGLEEINLKIDYRSYCDGRICGWPLKDLVANDPFFNECDIKAGDSKSSAISWHVFTNNAWGRIRAADVIDWEYHCNEPESLVDSTCGTDEYDAGQGLGELSENIYFTLWMDEGKIAGWQCPTQAACGADSLEGDGIRNGLETSQTPFAENILLKNFPANGYNIPDELLATNTYYVGIQWAVPSGVENIIQTDSINVSFIMEVVQSMDNPSKIFP